MDCGPYLGLVDLGGNRSDEVAALMRAAKAVLAHDDFQGSARAIFDEARELTGATAGYVALLSEDGAENEVLFLEAGGLECTVSEDLPMPIRGLRADAYHTNAAVMENDFEQSKWWGFLPAGHVTLGNVMFAPLNIGGDTVGIMGLANKPVDFTERDLEMCTAFGELAALALVHSRNRDLLRATITDLDRRNQELQQANRLVKRLLNTDPLTRVHTRAHFSEQVERQLAVRRRRGRTFCVAMIDLDHFKRVNDSHGHSVGDQVLRAVGRLLRTATRREDVVGRFGGEEFQLLMPDLGLEEAVRCAERLRVAVAGLRFDVEGLEVTASFGVVEATPEDTAESLEKRSDEAMYRAKRAGRDRVES